MTRARLRNPKFSGRLIREFFAIHDASGLLDKTVEIDAGVARSIISHLRRNRYRTITVTTLEALLNAHGYTLKIERIEE